MRLEFLRYRLPLHAPIRTAHQVWTEREGIVLRLCDDGGMTGYGEAAPVPSFGTETVGEAEAFLRGRGGRFGRAELGAVPARCCALRSALAAAFREIDGPQAAGGSPFSGESDVSDGEAGVVPESRARAVAALLPSGRRAAGELHAKAEAGFRVFKWKVGVGDAGDELALLDDLLAALPRGGMLRLDANGAWDRRRAERWLDRCADRPIEFVEQPCRVSRSEGETERRREEDLLLGLASSYPTPIALDEALVNDGDVDRWLGLGWPGWFIVKPSLLGAVDHALSRLAAAGAIVVFSSALETAVGARAALQRAFEWRGPAKALGFGVWPLFADARFDGPRHASHIDLKSVLRIDREAAWNALS